MKTFQIPNLAILNSSLAVLLLCSAASAHALNKNERDWESLPFSVQPHVQSQLPDGQVRVPMAYQLKRHLLDDGAMVPGASTTDLTSASAMGVACNEAAKQERAPNAYQRKRLLLDSPLS